MRCSRVGDDLAKWFERLIDSAKVAKVLGSIPASTDTVEYEGRQMNKILSKNNNKKTWKKNLNEHLFRM
jgi:hypothetical protein